MLANTRLGQSDIEIRPLGVGTNSWSLKTLEASTGALEAAAEAGIRLIDTAEVYGFGESEQVIGRILEGRPLDLVLATKFAPHPLRWRASSLSRALGRSLDRLRRSSVDLYQLHWPYSFMTIETLVDRLADEVERGRVRGVGVSNYGPAELRRAHSALTKRGVPLLSNQVHYSLLHRAPEANGTLALCRELGITLIAYFPLASGALTGKYRPGRKMPGGMRAWLPAFRRLQRALPLIEELERIGAEHGRSAGQVALNWLARQEGVVPIPGAKNAAQAVQNAAAIDFRITDADARSLESLCRV